MVMFKVNIKLIAVKFIRLRPRLHWSQTCVSTFNPTSVSRLFVTKGFHVLSLLIVSDMNVTYASDDDWDEFLLIVTFA